jgi:hypothetical protein
VTYGPDLLYNLLPAVQRIRDAQQGEPLRQLLALITRQVGVLQEDLDQLYDNQFIETCAPWVLPYIGDLIGYTSLHPVSPNEPTARAEVANTIAYRRRKGTASVLEQLARDVTLWNARAVEFFQLLATTQFMNHIRLTNWYAPDLRQWEPLERLGTAFETTAHTVDVRRVASGEGKYNIPNVGIFLWRLDAFPLHGSPAAQLDANRYFFSSLGANLPLFTNPQTEASIAHLATPLNVPEPISRRVLDAALSDYYGADLSLFIDGMPIADVAVCNLSDDGAGWAHVPPSAPVAIDPLLGRIAFRDPPAQPPLVYFHYGFRMALGGGEYPRAATFDADLAPIETVASPGPMQPAIDARAGGGVVELSDNGRFAETPSIDVNAGVEFELRAADKHRPTIVTANLIDITGGADAELTLNGLLVTGNGLRILSSLGDSLRKVTLTHCTIVPGYSLGVDGTPASPGATALAIEQTENPIEIDIDHCILGPIRAPLNATVLIRNSILDANSDDAVAFAALDGVAAGGTLSVVNTTVIGTVHTQLLKLASNSIFVARTTDGSAPVRSERQQTGCVRFSWLPLTSRVPRRYRCQPDLEIAEQIDAAIKNSASGTISSAERQAITDSVIVRLVPAFTSLRYADPGFCQLRLSVPEQIRAGADDEAEMGAFHDLFEPQRASNLRARLDEYLRFGLEAGIFYQT